MKLKLPHRVAGPFATVDHGGGVWSFTSGGGGNEVHVRGVEPGAAAALRGREFDAVTIEWRAQGVTLVLVAERRETSLAAHSAMCHEPAGEVFGVLPLARFDDKARGFWRRVFWVMRLPGGRHLLRLISARSVR